MSVRILTNCFISIDGTEYSGKNTAVAISMSAEAKDITAMGDETRKNAGGLIEWSMAMEFNGDESTTGQFFDLLRTTVPVEVRASADPVSATNPAYKGDAVITEYTPLDGSVGDEHKVSLSLVSAGPLTRVTSAV